MAEQVEHRWTDARTDRVYERWSDGIWRYAGGSIVVRYPAGSGEVPGARDRTLTEAYKPRKMIGDDGAPIAMFIPIELISQGGHDLEWATKVGDWVGESKSRKGVIVGLDEWQRHDVDVTALSAPELDVSSPLNKLALAERNTRLAVLAAEEAAASRNQAVRDAVRDGVPRHTIAQLLGVSVGRVGQLLSSNAPESPPDKAAAVR